MAMKSPILAIIPKVLSSTLLTLNYFSQHAMQYLHYCTNKLIGCFLLSPFLFLQSLCQDMKNQGNTLLLVLWWSFSSIFILSFTVIKANSMILTKFNFWTPRLHMLHYLSSIQMEMNFSMHIHCYWDVLLSSCVTVEWNKSEYP